MTRLFQSADEDRQSEASSHAFKASLRFEAESSTWTDTYLVQHLLTPSSGDENLDKWAKDKKLVPWVALAAPIQVQHRPFQGSLFSTLSLPIMTHHPLHIHGLFAIPPDRERLGRSDMEVTWNKFLFSRCIAKCWTLLLSQDLTLSLGEDAFTLWPSSEVLVNNEDPWTDLLERVLKIAIVQNSAIWISINAKPTTFNEAFYARKEDDCQKYREAFAAMDMPIILLKPALHDALFNCTKTLRASAKTLTSDAVRRHLPAVKKISKVHAPLMIEYAILDLIKNPKLEPEVRSAFMQFAEAKVWPTLDNNLRSSLFVDYFLLPRDSGETLLFSQCRREITLDRDALTAKVLQFLQARLIPKAIAAIYRCLDDLQVDWPKLFSPATSSSESSTLKYEIEDASLLNKMWAWIAARRNNDHDTLPQSAGALYLIPLLGQRIRKLNPEKAKAPTLVMCDSHPLGSVFLNPALSKPFVETGIVDTGVLGKAAVTVLEAMAENCPDNRLATPKILSTFVEWLHAAKNAVRATQDKNKIAIIAHLASLAEVTDFSCMTPTLKAQIMALPLFSKSIVSLDTAVRTICKAPLEQGIENHSLPPGLPPVPDMEGLALYDTDDPKERYLFKELRLLSDYRVEHFLDTFILPFIQVNLEKTTTGSVIDWIFDQIVQSPGQLWASLLNKWPAIPVRSEEAKPTLTKLASIIDPDSPFATMYFENEGVFPIREFYEKHARALKICGMSTGADWPSALLDRAKVYSHHPAEEKLVQKVAYAFRAPIHSQMSMNDIQELRHIHWLPATDPNGNMKMFTPSTCRGLHQSDLVDKVWGKLSLDPGSEWKAILGWNEPIPSGVLLEQLRSSIHQSEHSKVNNVLTHLEANDVSALQGERCILGADGQYVGADTVFNPGYTLKKSPMTPYLDHVDRVFASEHPLLLKHLGVNKEPRLADLKNVQGRLLQSNSEGLKGTELATAIASLEVAVELKVDDDQLSQLLVPDTSAKLRSWFDIVHGQCTSIRRADALNFVHPRMSKLLIDQLKIEHCDDRTVQLAIGLEDDDDDNDEFAPHERPTTVINDTLGRYPIESTFNEFLANAEDAGATRIHWILDQRVHKPDPNFSDLTRELKSMNGPALCIYNDQVFSETDFHGFKDVGQGGKKEQAESIGMFGRGVLSMYHFTNVPMLLSGGFVVFLDPQQKFLTRRPRGPKRKLGQKLPLSLAKKLARSQLALFDGVENYQADMDFFKGTIFRLPLYDPSVTTELRDNDRYLGSDRVMGLLADYMLTARVSLLFLASVCAVQVSRQHDTLDQIWSVSISRPSGWIREVFHDVHVNIDEANSISRYDEWRVALSDVNEGPMDIQKPGKASIKITECGIAACLRYDQPMDDNSRWDSVARNITIGSTKVEHHVYCKLPVTAISGLPISLHASFAVTGDRKTIAIDGDSDFAVWNRWILTNPMTELWTSFLKDLAIRFGPDAFKFWPHISSNSPLSVSKMLTESFYTSLFKHHQSDQLFPLIERSDFEVNNDPGSNNLRKKMIRAGRSLHEAVSLVDADFSTLSISKSALLHPLLLKLPLNIVRPPIYLWNSIDRSAEDFELRVLGLETLSSVLKEASVTETLQHHIRSIGDHQEQLKFYKAFLELLVPSEYIGELEKYKALHGCHIVPRPDLNLPLGRLSFDLLEGADWHLLVDDTTHTVLRFANDAFAHSKIILGEAPNPSRDPLSILSTAGANIRRLKLLDVGLLLARPDSPLSVIQSGKKQTEWLKGLWQYLNTQLLVKDDRQPSNLIDAIVADSLSGLRLLKLTNFEDSITSQEFEEGSFVLRPSSDQQQKLCNDIHWLRQVDPDFVPTSFARMEASLNRVPAFARFVEALRRAFPSDMDQLRGIIASNLSYESSILLRDLLDKYLATLEERNKIPNLGVLQVLPVWPRIILDLPGTSSQDFLAAKDAYFCESHDMFGPWTHDISRYVDPVTVVAYKSSIAKLCQSKVSVMQMWDRSRNNLPAQLSSPEMIQKFLRFTKMLAKNNVKSDYKIAPDGEGNLQLPCELFDHDESLFADAFYHEQDKRFLVPEFRVSGLRQFFLKLGLRSANSTRGISGKDYLACAQAVDQRSSLDSSNAALVKAARAVRRHLRWEKKEFEHWDPKIWLELGSLRVFKCVTDVTDQPMYRRVRMQTVAKGFPYCSFEEAIAQPNLHLCWSQVKIVRDPLATTVVARLPNKGLPGLLQVFEHLIYMVETYSGVPQNELSRYLQDVRGCYKFLQNQSETIGLPKIKTAKIWFNLDSTDTDRITKDQLDICLYGANQLCLEAPCKLPILAVKTS